MAPRCRRPSTVPFTFAVAAVAVVGAKLVHVYAHHAALPPSALLRYGLSFFVQDVALLLVLRILLDGLPFSRLLRLLFAALASAAVVLVLLLAIVTISFLVAGSELHWRNIGLASHSSWAMLLTGLLSCSLVTATLLLMAWLLQDLCYAVAAVALDLLSWPVTFLFSRLPRRPRRMTRTVGCRPLLPYHVDGAAELEFGGRDDVNLLPHPDQAAQGPPPPSRWGLTLYLFVGATLLAAVATSIVRPHDSSLTFMSWTLPLLPLVDFAHASPNLSGLLPSRGTGMDRSWDNRTALAEPPPFSWLPSETPLQGFEDWYEGEEHYRASEDPLKISNLEDEPLPVLRDRLRDVKIRHVVLIILESTRKDVFPIKKGGIIWERLVKSFVNDTLPDNVLQRLATLTQTANLLTGDYDDGFEHVDKKRRGGININNAHTTSTYTLKSLAGTLCGLTPLVADFNLEHENHIYQPCLAHILDAFNALDHQNDTASAENDFTSFRWRSTFMQSVTDTYDRQDAEMPVLGYSKERLITKEYLQSGSAKFGKVDIPDINYYGMPEVAIKDYIRDAFASAREKRERVFLTHLTSTTHHPFGMPAEEDYVPLAGQKSLDDLSHYVNAVGYVDRWLGQILDILEEQGVANETLLALVGDHGLSVPENGGLTPYYNANIGNFHIPMVLSHPEMPHVDIDDAVVSLQVLPTILDLLIESGSLSESERQAAHDLVRNYEGQSLIRPLRKASRETGQGDWQFTVMNPGRAMLSVRDARRPHWRLIVPIVDDTEWRFTDLAKDAHEAEPVLSFTFGSFLGIVEKEHGADAAEWAEEAAFMTRWWVEENKKRWRYGST